MRARFNAATQLALEVTGCRRLGYGGELSMAMLGSMGGEQLATNRTTA